MKIKYYKIKTKSGDPLANAHKLIDAMVAEVDDSYFYLLEPERTEKGRALADSRGKNLLLVLQALVARTHQIDNDIRKRFASNRPTNDSGKAEEGKKLRFVYSSTVSRLINKKIECDKETLLTLARWLENWYLILNQIPIKPIFKQFVAYRDKHGAIPITVTNILMKTVEQISKQKEQLRSDREIRDFKSLVQGLLELDPALAIVSGEAWADQAIADIQASRHSATWIALIEQARSLTAAKPSAKWKKQAGELLDKITTKEFIACLTRWAPMLDKPHNQVPPREHPWQPNPAHMIGAVNGDILKGLVWCAGIVDDPAIARTLTTVALSSYKKVPGVGPRLVRLGNAAVNVLGTLPGLDGVYQLAILRVKVKFGTAQKLIETAMTAAAEREGLPRNELEEIAVPTYGMEAVGIVRESLGDVTAELDARDGVPVLRWIKPDGKLQKSIPAAIKTSHAADIKDLKQAAKDIQKMLPAQKERVEQIYLQEKSWPYALWRERYLDHPLMGILARRLIWSFKVGSRKPVAALCMDGEQFIGAHGKPITEAFDDSTVCLWHPLAVEENEVVAWRTLLETEEIRQPFKQAHREVYLLTDAERQTHVYSNRFAAHILKQHQYNALCGARGWRNKLRLMVDDEYPPTTKVLPAQDLRAEFWVEGLGEEYDVDTTESGAFLYLATDQVRFYRMDAAQRAGHASGGGYHTYGPEGSDEPLPLAEIPPLVLSEVLRDVDLFVGVASVGNDPTWADGGSEGRYVDYWQGYSFGELNETAKSRRDLLQRLIPKLKIAEQCSFEEKFLVIRGNRRTYKIHLGSGNILIAPKDTYLCIVPGQFGKLGEKIFLPFEGDRTLSIILSKAFLLADDDKIKDRTILSQIR